MKEEYQIYYRTKKEEVYIGRVYDYENGTGRYTPIWGAEKCRKMIKDKRFFESAEGTLDFISEMMSEENRDRSRRREVYFCGKFIVWRVAGYAGKSFVVYRRSARKGEEGYSEKNHERPHAEPGTNDMVDWVNCYRFNRFDDGTYEAELDEAWYYGGSHTDGGTVNREIPDYWQDLPYEEFISKVVEVAGASRYQFTAEDLLALDGLKEFFGY